jgi:hypothetical protein
VDVVQDIGDENPRVSNCMHRRGCRVARWTSPASVR